MVRSSHNQLFRFRIGISRADCHRYSWTDCQSVLLFVQLPGEFLYNGVYPLVAQSRKTEFVPFDPCRMNPHCDVGVRRT
jgi:hypothetical protein